MAEVKKIKMPEAKGEKRIENETLKAGDVGRGAIVHDIFEDGLRFIIRRGPCNWCGYIGVPEGHPLAGFGYDEISFISAHGGLTFSDGGDGKLYPAGYWWYGWDYGHAGDKSVGLGIDGKDWTVKEVIEDSWETLYEFKKLRSLVEKVVKNAKK